jgi:hypothetical protein
MIFTSYLSLAPSPTKSYPYFLQNAKYRNKHLFGQNQFSLVKSGCLLKSQATRKMSENGTNCWRDNKTFTLQLDELGKKLVKDEVCRENFEFDCHCIPTSLAGFEP